MIWLLPGWPPPLPRYSPWCCAQPRRGESVRQAALEQVTCPWKRPNPGPPLLVGKSGTCSACTHFPSNETISPRVSVTTTPSRHSEANPALRTILGRAHTSPPPPLSSSLRGAVPSSAASGRQPAKAFSLNLFGGQFHGKRQSRPLVPVVSVTDHRVQHSRRERITRPDRAADAKSILASGALLRGSGGPSM